MSTVVHPVAVAAPTIHQTEESEPFQGIMPPFTPAGAFNVIVVTSPGRPFSDVSPRILRAKAAKN